MSQVVTYLGTKGGHDTSALEAGSTVLPLGEPVTVSDEVAQLLDSDGNHAVYRLEFGEQKGIEKLTKDQLLALAAERGIEIPADTTKRDEIAAHLSEQEVT